MSEMEVLQKLIARTVARYPAGRNVMMIGGFRYRFLDNSVRTSADIDYHWAGDLDRKQAELLALFKRFLLPEVQRILSYEGFAELQRGPDADSPNMRGILLAFWKPSVPWSRVEIPIEITRIVCADPVHIRTVEGTIYATASDADMIESKILALFNRPEITHRDLVDIYLFQGHLISESRARLASKRNALKLSPKDFLGRLENLRLHASYHGKATQTVIDTQLEPAAARQLTDAGGGLYIVNTVQTLLDQLLEAPDESH